MTFRDPLGRVIDRQADLHGYFTSLDPPTVWPPSATRTTHEAAAVAHWGPLDQAVVLQRLNVPRVPNRPESQFFGHEPVGEYVAL